MDDSEARIVQRAGVAVIHIINQELLQHGTDAITKLLPDDVVCYWKLEDEEPLLWNPVTTFPF